MRGVQSRGSREITRQAANKQGSGGLESAQTTQLASMEARANQSPRVRETAQLQEKLNVPNTTGMSDNLKGGLESLSGFDLSSVQVHYDSPKPAQLQAHAYTQGRDIFVAPGQEQHVPHEGWHVVQQMQGRVQPTMQLAGTDINDSPALETEADVMGDKASGFESTGTHQLRSATPPTGTAQRAMGLEFETGARIRAADRALQYHDLVYRPASGLWRITVDDPAEDGTGVLEFVTEPFENDGALLQAMREIEQFVAALRSHVRADQAITISDVVDRAKLDGFATPGIFVGGKGFEPKNLQARPQMTLGVPLDRMNDVMMEARSFTLDEWFAQHGEIPQVTLESDPMSSRLAVPTESDPVDVAVAWGAQLREDNPKLNPVAVQQLVGLMSLVLRYLNEGYFKPPGPAAPYAKSYFPVMARTDFHSMWMSLPKSVRDLFTPEAALALWGYPADTIERLSTGRSSQTMFSRGYREGGGAEQRPEIYDWLLSIVDPKARRINTKEQREADDRLIAHYKGNPEYGPHVARAKNKDLLSRGKVAFNSTSMGLWEMDRGMALLEFRGFPEGEKGGLAPRFWMSLAQRLFTFAQRTTGRVSSDELVKTMPVEEMRSLVSRQLGALATTQDDEFNARVLVYRKAALESLGEVDAEGLPAFIQTYNKDASSLVKEFYDRPKSHAPQLPDLGALSLEGAADSLANARSAGGLLQKMVVEQLDGLKETSSESLREDLTALRKQIATLLKSAATKGDPAEMAGLLGQAAELFAKSLPNLRTDFFNSETKEKTTAKPDERVGEGGNCLFDSVSRMLAGTIDNATLRQRTANEVRAHPLQYVDRLVADGQHDDVMVEMAEAADFLAVNNNWDANAGEIAPLALANALRRRINVYNMDGSLRTVVGFFNEHPPVSIYYNGWNHYMPMI